MIELLAFLFLHKKKMSVCLNGFMIELLVSQETS